MSISRLRKWFIPVIFLYVFHCCFLDKIAGQTAIRNIDDSIESLVKLPLGDTQKINQLLNYSYRFRVTDTTRSRLYAELALKFADKTGWVKGKVEARIRLGVIYQGSYGNLKLALKQFDSALTLLTIQTDISKREEVLCMIANVYSEMTEYKIAIRYYRMVLDMHADPNQEFGAASNLGVIYSKLGDYASSLFYCDSSLKLYTNKVLQNGVSESIDTIQMAGVVYQKGELYLTIKDYPKARACFESALATLEATHESSTGITYALIGLGKVFAAENNVSKGIVYLNRSLLASRNLGSKTDEAAVLDLLGQFYMQANDLGKAQENAEQALHLAEANNLTDLLPEIYKNLGRIYVALKDYRKGFELLRKCVEMAKKSGALELERDAEEALSRAYELNGKPQLALEAYKHFVNLRDSLYNIDKAKELYRIDLQADFDRQNLVTTAKYELKTEKQRVWIYSGFAGMALLLLLAFFIYKNYNQQKKANVIIHAEKQKAEEQRMRAEKSEAFKQQFLANMSHEIRTPMNAVMGMTNLVLDTQLEGKQKFYMEGIKKSGDNLLHIINDILDLSKIEAGKMELEQIDFSISNAVEQVRQTLNYKAEEKGLVLVTFIEPGISDLVVGDPVRLNQVLINLMGNAIKFTERGSVALTLRNMREGVKFEITDTGIGISKDKIEQVFEKFSQANASDTRKYGGTGLGLSISRQLVELMGGNIGIESEEGAGTTFYFTIHFEEGSEEQLARRMGNEAQLDGSILNGLSILIVDDNEYNRIVARDTLLSKANLKVDTASSGRDGIVMLGERHYDVVLMDVQMPGMNGFEATRVIRNSLGASFCNIPIIALTASVLRTDLDKCSQAGMNTYLSKPFKAYALIAAVADVLNIELRTVERSGNAEIIKVPDKGIATDLSYLTEYCEGETDRMRKYVAIYLKAAMGFEERIDVAMVEGDAEIVAGIAHSFRPKWMMMGMKESTAVGKEVEVLIAADGSVGNVREQISRLKELNRLSIGELEKIV